MSKEDLRPVRELAVSRRVLTPPPARSLDDAVRLCDPFSPLHPSDDIPLHEDLTQIRGGDRLSRIARNIERAGGTPTLHLLCGHLGSGKTTELLRMKRRLETQSRGQTGAATVLFLDADAMLDRADVDLEDILVALWGLVFREAPQTATKVLSEVWKARIGSIVGGLLANLPDKAPEAISKLLGDVRLPGIEQKKNVRLALGRVVPALIEGLNQAFETIHNTPPNDPTSPLVVLIDNLEKLSEGQRANVERLYLERMGALKSLEAHLVITVPLYLCYAAAGASLIGLYGGEIVVLPMIEVRKRVSEGGGDKPEGLAAMTHLLQRRVDFDALFEEKSVAAERIARVSGGCIRHALRIVQGAVNEHDAPPVTQVSVDRAIGTVQADFERALPESYVPALKKVMETNRFPDDIKDEIKRDLLRHLYVLEYQNGAPGPWYGVHPLVERCCNRNEARSANERATEPGFELIGFLAEDPELVDEIQKIGTSERMHDDLRTLEDDKSAA